MWGITWLSGPPRSRVNECTHTWGEDGGPVWGRHIAESGERVMGVSCQQRGRRLATGQETSTEGIAETVVSDHEQSASGAASPQGVSL